MVQRIALALAVEKGLGDAPTATVRAVGQVANEADAVRELLGPDLYPRLKHYVESLATKVVRGRHPDAIVDDPKARAGLYVEIAEEMSHLPPAPMSDPAAVARQVKNALTLKLGGK